jgi:hypothetical protein
MYSKVISVTVSSICVHRTDAAMTGPHCCAVRDLFADFAVEFPARDD